jgi:hypothetical protein
VDPVCIYKKNFFFVWLGRIFDKHDWDVWTIELPSGEAISGLRCDTPLETNLKLIIHMKDTNKLLRGFYDETTIFVC